MRELVAGVLLIPLGFTLAWLSIFGNSALDLVMNQGAVELGKTALEQPSMAIYQLLEHYPASKVVIGVSIFVGFVLFLTPADSGAVMMANLSCKGGNVDEDAPHWLRIFWSVVITLVTIGLLFAGNFEAMQTMVVLAGLPFSVVLVFFMFGLHKAMRQDVQIEQEQAQLAQRGSRGFSEPDATGPATEPVGGAAFHGQAGQPGAGRRCRTNACTRSGGADAVGQIQALHGRAH